jgi:hypothetical protein
LFSQTVYKTESVWYTKKTFWCEFFLIKFGEERKYFLQQKKHFGAKRDFLVGEKMGVLSERFFLRQKRFFCAKKKRNISLSAPKLLSNSPKGKRYKWHQKIFLREW